jgi:hypothetical protein
VGDFQSPSALLLLPNGLAALSLFRVRGTCPDFRIPQRRQVKIEILANLSLRGAFGHQSRRTNPNH